MTPSSDTYIDTATFLILVLLDNPEPQMRDARGLYHPGAFQFKLLSAYMFEQADACTE